MAMGYDLFGIMPSNVEWQLSLSSAQLAALGTLTLFVLTYIVSLSRFLWTRQSQNPEKGPPTVPYYLPGLCHAFRLEWSMTNFLTATVLIVSPTGQKRANTDSYRKRWGYVTPLKVRAEIFQFIMVTNPSHIRSIIRSSRILTNRPMMMFAMRKWFNTPVDSMHHYDSHHGPHTYLHDLQYGINIRYLSGKSILTMSERYLAIIQRRLAALDVPTGEKWLEIPDFYIWLQSQVTPSAIEATMGSRILEMYPTLVEDFWEFDRQLGNYSRGLPRWMILSAYRTRDRLLANLKAWNRMAHRHSDCSKHGVDDADWDEFFGTRYIKAREDLMRKHGLNDDVIASENLGLLFGYAFFSSFFFETS